jgi:hypothetical protein
MHLQADRLNTNCFSLVSSIDWSLWGCGLKTTRRAYICIHLPCLAQNSNSVYLNYWRRPIICSSAQKIPTQIDIPEIPESLLHGGAPLLFLQITFATDTTSCTLRGQVSSKHPSELLRHWRFTISGILNWRLTGFLGSAMTSAPQTRLATSKVGRCKHSISEFRFFGG